MSPMAQDLFIFHDDEPDADNWATAKVLWQASRKDPSMKVIWVIEPRQVALGQYRTPEQQKDCVNLLETKFKGKGRNKLLNGLEKHEFAYFDGMDETQKKLLSMAVSPEKGPKEDAQLHGYCMALLFANYLAELDQSTDETRVFLDVESLDTIVNPVNLNVHHHEELVDLTESELKDFRNIMAVESDELRVEEHRRWYRSLIVRQKERAAVVGASVRPLDIDYLCNEVETAESVRFFGGSSAGLLQRLVQRGVAGKIECCLQLGTFDPNKNLFSNQFNITLNPDAAIFVMFHYEDFKRFVVVPSDSTLNVKYRLDALSGNDQHLAKRLSAFLCHVDVMELGAKGTAKGLSTAAVVPDLTAFLSGFSTSFPGRTLRHATLIDRDGKPTLKRNEDGKGFFYWDLEVAILEAPEIEQIIAGVSVGKILN